ncbi:MAG: cation-translocating P-type ATPase [Ignavibacteriales bacterium]
MNSLLVEAPARASAPPPHNWQGLSDWEARRRLARYGPNELERERGPNPLRMFIQQFEDVLVLLLIAAAAVSALAGEWVDASIIMAIVVVNAVTGVVQEYRAERALAALREMAAPVARACRQGLWKAVRSRDLVPGDLVAVEAGDRVPADVRIVEAFNLKVDESVLTGESVPVEKDGTAGKDELFASTTVVYGRCKGIVSHTGMNTRVGLLAGAIGSSPDEEPPLKKKLDLVGQNLALACMTLVAVTFGVGIFRGEQWLEMFLASVSLGVAAIPEGLPAIVTIVLAIGTRRMSRQNAIVRRLASVETLGSVTVVCSDKTGTLTRNEMCVTQVFAGGRKFCVSGTGYSPEGEIRPAEDDGPDGGRPDGGRTDDRRPCLERLLLGGLLASDALLQKDGKGWHIIGDPTEGALVVAAAKAGLKRDECERLHPRVFEIPFDSARRMMTTVHLEPGRRGHPSRYTSFTKGAPDVVLARCTRVLFDGLVKPLDGATREAYAAVSAAMAGEALRVLAVATRDWEGEGWRDSLDAENGLTFVGYLGMMDPPRPEAIVAVATCRKAGVRPLMVTGDQGPTALAVARRLGIAGAGTRLILGGEIDSMDDARLTMAARSAVVYAQVSPEHKARIVTALKRDGHIVAMTGDGVNDAPALKWADIGIAMGIKGTDVAKEASDMILADDNFATIIRAIAEGRTIYANVRKSIRYLLSCNTGELITVMGAVLAGLGRPLLAAQILWVNLVTDAAPAIALGMEKPEYDVITTRPPAPEQGIFTWDMTWRILVEGLWIGCISLGTYWMALKSGEPVAVAQSMCFGVLTFSQLFHANNCRSHHQSLFRLGMFGSVPMMVAVAISSLVQLFAMWGPLRPVFGVAGLNPAQWCWVGAASATMIPLAEVMKNSLPTEDALGRRAGHQASNS